VTVSRAPRRAVVGALELYSLWVLFTYLLEGRQQTLLRPEATTLRLVYVLVANLADPTSKTFLAGIETSPRRVEKLD
jgi:hypothetical protein